MNDPTPSELLERYENLRYMLGTLPDGENEAEQRVARRLRELIEEEHSAVLMQLVQLSDPRWTQG